MKLNDVTKSIIGTSVEVHNQLGPGLLESAYQKCLLHKLTNQGLTVRNEVPRPVIYKEIRLDHGYQLDLLVEEKVVVELKTVEMFTDVHVAQLLTYLKLGNYELGLLINFNVQLLKEGIKRIINLRGLCKTMRFVILSLSKNLRNMAKAFKGRSFSYVPQRDRQDDSWVLQSPLKDSLRSSVETRIIPSNNYYTMATEQLKSYYKYYKL